VWCGQALCTSTHGILSLLPQPLTCPSPTPCLASPHGRRPLQVSSTYHYSNIGGFSYVMNVAMHPYEYRECPAPLFPLALSRLP